MQLIREISNIAEVCASRTETCRRAKAKLNALSLKAFSLINSALVSVSADRTGSSFAQMLRNIDAKLSDRRDSELLPWITD